MKKDNKATGCTNSWPVHNKA